MKIFKYLFLLFIIIIIGGSLYIATIDDKFDFKATVITSIPQEVAFTEINNLENWKKWNPLQTEDPTIQFSLPEKTIGKNASISWNSEKFGTGNITTLETLPYNSITQEITYKTVASNPTQKMYWIFEEKKEKNAIKISWGIKGKLSFLEKIYLIINNENHPEKQLKPHLEKGLANLINKIEKEMQAYDIHIDGVTKHGGGFYMYNTTATKNTPENLSKKMARMFPQITQYMTQHNIEITGAPFALYNKVDKDNNSIIFSAGIPTSNRVVTTSSDILCGYLPPQKTLKLTLKGNYNNIPKAWEIAQNYLDENNLKQASNGNAFEVYVNDPTEEPNPAKWITTIYIPIQQPNNTSEN